MRDIGHSGGDKALLLLLRLAHSSFYVCGWWAVKETMGKELKHI